MFLFEIGRRTIQISGVALVSRALNKPKYKPRNVGKKSNQISPIKRTLPNALNSGVGLEGVGPLGHYMGLRALNVIQEWLGHNSSINEGIFS